MHNFFKQNNEKTGARIDLIFEPNEKYAIDDNGKKIANPDYTKKKADQWELSLRKQNAMNSNSPDDMKLLSDPKSALYDHAYARQHADDGYRPIEDQQDMQYWDAVNGTTTWQDHIRSVKEKYPKKD